MNNLDQARAWARDNIDDFCEGERVYAVCEVIQSLPDEWIDAEKVRELIDTYKHARDGNAAGTEGWVMNHLVVRNLESLLTPPLPTLADMTPEERQQCRGMWCDYRTVNGDLVQVIYRGQRSGLASVHDPKTQDERTNFLVMAQSVTPRFDLPRAWNPDGTPAATTEEVEYRIVDPDTNGGRYEMRRWVRGVTEWRLDGE